MVKIKSLGLLVVLLAVALFFSSLTMWLLQSWVKYPLFIIEVITIVLIYFAFTGYDIRFKAKVSVKSNDVAYLLSLLLIVFPLVLLLFHLASFENSVPQLVLAFFVTTFLSGFAIINITKLQQHLTKLETILLSYVLSFIVTGFLTLVFLSFGEQVRIIASLCAYLLLGLISAYCLYARKTFNFLNEPSFSKRIDSLSLLVSIVFFAIAFSSMYPNFVLMPGNDISRHYNWCLVLNRSPQLYIGSAYLFSHLNEATFLAISDAHYLSSQLALLCTNLLLPVAFYVMAKRYLSHIDASLPSVATLMWTLCTNSYGGFSWIYLAFLKIAGSTQNQLQLLNVVADKTYNGTIYGILGLWYVPSIVSFILLITSIFLLSKTEISSHKFVALFSLVIAALYLTHITEAVVIIIFLSLYGIFIRSSSLRISEALKGSVLAFGVILIVYYFFSLFTSRFIITTNLLASIVFPLLAVILSLGIRATLSFVNLRIKISHLLQLKHNFLKYFGYALAFIYLTALISWVYFLNTFHTSQVDGIGNIPWFIYPFMLGITGLLSVAAINIFIKKPDEKGSAKFFIVFLAFLFIAGMLVSIMNLYFFNVSYWEKRFLWFIKIPLAILAPLPLLLLIKRIKLTFSSSTFKLISIALISIVCVYGVSTTFLNVDYWSISSSNTNNFATSAESTAINSLKEILNNDPTAWTATVTSTSAAMVTLAGPPDALGLRQLLYATDSQEMALTQLYRASMYDHPYLYIHSRDQAYLSNYGNGFLANYLPTLYKAYENSEVSIYTVPALSYPQSSSDVALIVPYDQSLSIDDNFIYGSLAYNQYNFTTVYDLDHSALNYSTVIVPFDIPTNDYVMHSFVDDYSQMPSSTVQKGTWTTINQQLVGGTPQGNEGFIIYPIAAENFSIEVKLNPLIGNSSILNYASIVYSWQDAKNYCLADIFFSNDNYVYILFRDFSDGKETSSPSWPGQKTNIKWSFGDTFSAKLNVTGQKRLLSLNETSISSTASNIAGQVGLHYNRFFQIGFKDFSVDYTSSITYKHVDEYLNYVQSGGSLIILDTTGDGYFSKNLLPVTSSYTDVKQFSINGSEYPLPAELSVQTSAAKANNTDVLGYYGNSVCPLLIQQNYPSGGQILYYNLTPLYNALKSAEVKSDWYLALTNILGAANLIKINDYNPLSQINGYAKSISSVNANIQTDSVLFSNAQSAYNITVISENEVFDFSNIIDIKFTGYSNVSIHTPSVVIGSGTGFYSLLTFNSTFSISNYGNATLKVTDAYGNVSFIHNVQDISISPAGLFNLYARTPELTSNEVAFTEMYLNNYPGLSVEVNGKNLSAIGFTKLRVAISDNYQAISGLTLPDFSGNNAEATQYDFLSTFPVFLLFCLLLIPAAIVFLLIVKKIV